MRIRMSGSAAHWRRPEMFPKHGPQVWPWWRLASFTLCRLEMYPPTTGYRLWIYTRWGALYGDVVFDRRAQVAQ